MPSPRLLRLPPLAASARNLTPLPPPPLPPPSPPQEVFLRIADNADAEDAAAEEARAGVEPVEVAHSRRPWGSAWPRLSAAKPPRQSAVAPAPPAGAAAAGPSAAASALASAYVASDVEGGSRYRGASGWAQVRLLSILYYQTLTSDWALPLMMAVTTAFTLAAFIIPAYLGYGNLDTVANRTDASLLPSVALSSPDAFESAAADLANAGAVAFPYAPETGTLQAGLGSAAFESAFGYSATPLQDAAGIGVAIRSAATGAFGAASLGADGAGSPPLPATSRLFHNRSHEAALPVTLHAISRALFASVGGNGTLSGAAALLPYVGETKPDLPFPYGSIISPNVLSFVFLFLALGAVSELVKQRLITKSNHQMMVMGLSPALRWVGELSVWLLLIWYHCALVLVVMLAMGSAAPTSAAVPVFFLEVLLAGPAAVCFFALFNFLFWCKIETANGADDLVGNVVCQVLQIFVMYPSVILSIPSVRESEVAFWVLTLFSLLTPVAPPPRLPPACGSRPPTFGTPPVGRLYHRLPQRALPRRPKGAARGAPRPGQARHAGRRRLLLLCGRDRLLRRRHAVRPRPDAQPRPAPLHRHHRRHAAAQPLRRSLLGAFSRPPCRRLLAALVLAPLADRRQALLPACPRKRPHPAGPRRRGRGRGGRARARRGDGGRRAGRGRPAVAPAELAQDFRLAAGQGRAAAAQGRSGQPQPRRGRRLLQLARPQRRRQDDHPLDADRRRHPPPRNHPTPPPSPTHPAASPSPRRLTAFPAGDLRPGGGDAWVCGYSVRTQLLDIFRLCGYCPQARLTRSSHYEQRLLTPIPANSSAASSTPTRADSPCTSTSRRTAGSRACRSRSCARTATASSPSSGCRTTCARRCASSRAARAASSSRQSPSPPTRAPPPSARLAAETASHFSSGSSRSA